MIYKIVGVVYYVCHLFEIDVLNEIIFFGNGIKILRIIGMFCDLVPKETTKCTVY